VLVSRCSAMSVWVTARVSHGSSPSYVPHPYCQPHTHYVPLEPALTFGMMLPSLALNQNRAWPPAAGPGDNSALAGPMHYQVSRDDCTVSGGQLTGPMHYQVSRDDCTVDGEWLAPGRTGGWVSVPEGRPILSAGRLPRLYRSPHLRPMAGCAQVVGRLDGWCAEVDPPMLRQRTP
jgi:hypothetical protein